MYRTFIQRILALPVCTVLYVCWWWSMVAVVSSSIPAVFMCGVLWTEQQKRTTHRGPKRLNYEFGLAQRRRNTGVNDECAHYWTICLFFVVAAAATIDTRLHHCSTLATFGWCVQYVPLLRAQKTVIYFIPNKMNFLVFIHSSLGDSFHMWSRRFGVGWLWLPLWFFDNVFFQANKWWDG